MIELTRKHFHDTLRATSFRDHADELANACAASDPKHGDWPAWADAIDAMPKAIETVSLGPVPAIEFAPTVNMSSVTDQLMQLQPWRKGPWRFGSVEIDSEWRSDWKWDRLVNASVDFQGARVLDIGGGNGYFSVRASQAGARAVLNVDPTLLFYAQFLAFARLAEIHSVAMVPLGFEALPPLGSFDVVMSMGVLYHRADPIAHLRAMKSRLARGGTAVVETLVVEGGPTAVLVPEGRYARMRNVWFLPSTAALSVWLQRAGFRNIQCHDVTMTTTREQRPTAWMQFESLAHALHPEDPTTTIEGHPAPLRALLTAEAT